MRYWVISALVVAVAATPIVLWDRFLSHLGVMVCIMFVMAISMNLMLRVGQLSLAQVVFMAVGAYGSAILSMRLGVPTSLAILISGLGNGLLALALGPILLRITGVYFVLLTFALAQIVNLILQDWTSMTGGNGGMFGIPKLTLFGYRFARPEQSYLMALVLAAVAFGVLLGLHRSRVASVMDSIDENEDLARALGVNVLAWRIGLFGLSGLMAGIAGGFYAHYIGFLSPDDFTFGTSVNLLVINVIGGVVMPIGVVIGAILLVPLPEVLRDAQEFQLLSYGALLIVFLAVFPNGISGFLFGARTRGKRTFLQKLLRQK